jgi:DNA-binding YbaB/EbfC family protein
MGFNYQEMMKQARAMQKQMEKIQEELKNTEYEASSGGGAVKVKVNGDQEILSLSIDKDAVDTGDISMLEDMVMVAVNDALKKSKDEASSKLSGLTGGMSIPGF